MRKRARLILGVDIDNVLAESDACLRAMIHQMFGIALRGEQVTQYDYMTSTSTTTSTRSASPTTPSSRTATSTPT